MMVILSVDVNVQVRVWLSEPLLSFFRILMRMVMVRKIITP